MLFVGPMVVFNMHVLQIDGCDKHVLLIFRRCQKMLHFDTYIWYEIWYVKENFLFDYFSILVYLLPIRPVISKQLYIS